MDSVYNMKHKTHPFIIRKAEKRHRPEIMALLAKVNMHDIPSEEMPGLTFKNYFVALINGKVVGFSGYKRLSSREAKTELMAVDPDCRGRGIGHALQTKRMEDMLGKGIQMLKTNADSLKTIHWYKKNFGYKEVGKLKKKHEFGDPGIKAWTTLRVDLKQWEKERERKNNSES